MADEQNQDTAEDGQEKENHAIEVPATAARSDESLPIEGESRWVMIMRLLAGSTFLAILVIGGVFRFLTGDDSFVQSQQLAMIMGGIVFLLVLEYFVFLLVVIPRQADYGRYVIHENKVDFYPLTALGLGIGPESEPVQMARFMGIATGRIAREKGGGVVYAVYLVHSENKGKTINVRNFPTLEEAEAFAGKLGGMLHLNVVSLARKGAAKKRAL